MYRFVIFFICVFTPYSLHALELLKSYNASYKLSTKNIKIAELDRKFLIQVNGDYRFLSTLSTAGVGKLISSLSRTQISIGKFIDGQFIPTNYSHQTQSDTRSYELKFDHTNQGATNSRKPSSLTLMPFDELSYQAQLQADLLNGINDYEYLVQKKHKQKLYTFRHEETEMITTKLGKFMCKKMVRVTNSSGKVVKIWLAESLNYIPVKIELISKQKKTIAILTNFSPTN